MHIKVWKSEMDAKGRRKVLSMVGSVVSDGADSGGEDWLNALVKRIRSYAPSMTDGKKPEVICSKAEFPRPGERRKYTMIRVGGWVSSVISVLYVNKARNGWAFQLTMDEVGHEGGRS